MEPTRVNIETVYSARRVGRFIAWTNDLKKWYSTDRCGLFKTTLAADLGQQWTAIG